MTDDIKPDAPFMRRIQTFMRRSSPFTASQKQGMADFAPRFLLPRSREPLDVAAVFGRAAPLTVEIGFGMGYSLAEMAEAAPERNFIGIEIHEPGVAQLCFELGTRNIPNVRILDEDALELLRHHKRRIVQPAFVALLVRKLKPGGLLHFATDWQNYAEWMLEVLQAEPALANLSPTGDYVETPAWRPHTKFEARGERLGHGVWDLLFRRRT